MKFLVLKLHLPPEPLTRGLRPHIPVLSVLCPQLNLLKPPPPKKIPGYTIAREQVSKQNFVNKINVQAEYFPIHSCFPFFFWLNGLLLLWVILYLFPVFIHKNRRKFLFSIRVTVWFRFRIGRHLLQNEHMHYDCLGKKIFTYDDKLYRYRFTGTSSFFHVCPRILNSGRRYLDLGETR